MNKAARSWRGRLARVTGACGVALALAVYWLWVFPFWGFPFNGQRHGRPPLTPPWALECWLWEDDRNTSAAVSELLAGYAAHDIPVRTILIDSPWSMRYNDFVVDTNRYPEPAQFFGDLQHRGYRVVLWMTSMVNSRSKDTALCEDQPWFEAAKRQGYLVGDGCEYRWWKGRGGLLDYTNPQALVWWQRMQQPLFDWGLDGWKLDGADTFFSSRFLGGIPIPYQRTHAGWKTTRGYMDLYARTEYRHGLTQNPEFVTLIRALDTPYAHPEGFAPLDAAPVTWVGDRTHEWETPEATKPDRSSHGDLLLPILGGRGFEAALRDILLSSRRGYAVVGCDIAGYHGDGPIPPRLYIRWAQFAAFTGLFLNGGHGERRLWKRSPQELEIIRKFSWLHTELVPYLYAQVVRCHQGGPPLMRPTQGKYHYLLGDDLLVAPIYRDSLTNQVTLPPGRWRYLFDDRQALAGPTTFERAFPLDEFPVYVRQGAILPLNVTRAYTGFGDTNSTGYLTLAIYPDATNTLTLDHPERNETTIITVTVTEAGETQIAVDGTPPPHILRIHCSAKPREVLRDRAQLAEGADWWHDGSGQRLWVKTRVAAPARYRIMPVARGAER